MTHLLTSWQKNKNYFCDHWFCNGFFWVIQESSSDLNCCLCVSDVKGANCYGRMCPWSKFQSEIALTTHHKTAKKKVSWSLWARESDWEKKIIILNKLTSSIFSGYTVVLSQTTVSTTLYPPTQKQFTQPKKLDISKKEVRNRQPLQLTSFALSATVKTEGNGTRGGFLNFQRRSRFCSGLFLNICDAHCWLATDAG